MYDENKNIVGGNATERALLTMIDSDEYKTITDSVKVTNAKSFNSANKFSAVETDGKDGKIIRVAAKVVHEHVLVQVINYGYVIPKEDLEKLFQKFYRVEQSRSQNTGGTGLGLAIVHQIAVLHGGDVQVKSDLDGTVFSVWLPLQQKKERQT